MSTWAGYRRVSRVGDREETLISPELQAAEIDRYAAGRGLTVEMLDPELDVSGGKAIRPILEQIVDGIETKRYAGVIVADIDRLSRLSLVDALQLIERVEGAGGQVISVAQNFDPGTPEGRWGRNIWLSTTHMQLERYGAAFRRAKVSSVERGVWPLPVAPVGYSVVRRRDGGDGRLHPNEDAPRVVEAFRMRAASKPLTAIADHLSMGRTSAGKVIRNRVYLGEINYAGAHNPTAHEPLVDVALFEAAQIEHPRPPRGVHGAALLAGLVRCAGCQRKMTPGVHRDGSRFYRCMPRKARGRCSAPAIIGAKKLEEYVERVFFDHLGTGQAHSRPTTHDLEAADRERQAAEAELAAYQQVTQLGDVGAEHFMEGMRARVAAVEAARERVGRLRALSGSVERVEDLRAVYERGPVEGRGHVLRGGLSTVWVRRGRGPCVERVRVVEAGHALDDNALRGMPLEPLDWVEHDLVGEIRPLGTE